VPLRVLNVLLGDDHTARTMKPRTIDQTRLKGLELLSRDNVIVNVDNHKKNPFP
jgi:hypothetical protein